MIDDPYVSIDNYKNFFLTIEVKKIIYMIFVMSRFFDSMIGYWTTYMNDMFNLLLYFLKFISYDTLFKFFWL